MLLLIMIFEEGQHLQENASTQTAYPKSEVIEHLCHFCSSTGFRLLQWFPASLGQSYPIPMYLQTPETNRSMAFEIMFLIHQYELIKTFSESLQQLPWHHHQKLKHFALSLVELHNSASSPPSYSHFNASLAAYVALIAMTTPRL